MSFFSCPLIMIMKSQAQVIQEILAHCSRDIEHEIMQTSLSHLLIELHDWETLINQAEHHGLAPLLYKHLSGIETLIPRDYKHKLQGLYLRHRQANTIRNKAIVEILNLFQRSNIDVLLIKGSALSNFLYSSNAMRPMRDIDILVRKEDANTAQQTLLKNGYQAEPHSHIPEGHHHLDPVIKKIDGMNIQIEIHHNLLPFLKGYETRSFNELLGDATQFKVNNVDALTLGLEDMLWYLYQHGLGMPITFGAFRFIHAADIITLVEKEINQINWDALDTVHPQIYNILSALHHLSPWSKKVITTLNLKVKQAPKGVGKPFTGWPARHLKEIHNENLPSFLSETFFPPQWWRQVYYGRPQGFSQLFTLFWDHPRNLMLWFKFYWPSFKNNCLTSFCKSSSC